MGLFDRFKKDKNQPADFSGVDSHDKAAELAEKEILAPLYLMPLRFNGEESAANRLFVPPAVVTLKDRYDDMVEKLLREGKVNGYACTPQYKEHSFVPSELEVTAKMDGKPVFSETIHIW